MKLPIFQVDAFSQKPFGGNPAAVIPLQNWLSDEVMQAIAVENNLSETAFCIPHEDGYAIRWFTPGAEVDLCGHATLATAFVLMRHGYHAHDSIVFQSKSGPLTVRKHGEMLELDFPSRPPEACSMPDRLSEALGGTPDAVLQGERDLLAVFADEAAVAALSPDMGALAQLDYFSVVATAAGKEVDFVSRFFAPKIGVPEDPVTGSAHCTLVPYWSKRLNKTQLHAHQISARGGELFCQDLGERVRIAGHAVAYLQGEITIEVE